MRDYCLINYSALLCGEQDFYGDDDFHFVRDQQTNLDL